MGTRTKTRKTPLFHLTSWTPSLVEDFLKAHGFFWTGMDGDDALWIGKTPQNQDAQVAFPRGRRELTPGAMHHSVMRASGYDRKHWDYWRSLRKSQRKKCFCCKKVYHSEAFCDIIEAY